LAIFKRDNDEVVWFTLIAADITLEERGAEREFLFPGLAEFADPDVAEANRIAVVLERNGLLFGMRTIGNAFEPTGGTSELDIILHEDTIVKNCNAGGRPEIVQVAEAGGGVNDIVGLPLARRERGIHKRRILAIDGSSGTIGVGGALIRIENLDFVAVEAEEDTTIAAALAFAVGGSRRGPLDVELAIAEILKRANVAAAFDTFHVAIFGDPLCGRSVHADPLGNIFAVKKHRCVGRRGAGFFRGAWYCRSNDRRLRAGAVVVKIVKIRLSLANKGNNQGNNPRELKGATKSFEG